MECSQNIFIHLYFQCFCIVIICIFDILFEFNLIIIEIDKTFYDIKLFDNIRRNINYD